MFYCFIIKVISYFECQIEIDAEIKSSELLIYADITYTILLILFT
jgi:hypothetical protein